MSNPFAYVELHTDAPAAAKAFYGQLLSWRIDDAPNSEGRYTNIQPGEGLPAGLTQNRYGGGSHWLPYIKVDDLAALARCGWTISDPASVACTPRAYRDFVRSSRGEFSIAN